MTDGIHSVRSGAGGGEPAVLLHGWPQTWWEWRAVLPLLASSREVHAVDLPGLGDSDPLTGGYSAVAAAAALEDWRRALGLGPVHLVGHDFGAPVGYAWAAGFRSSVRTLTLVDVPLHGLGLQELVRAAGLWHFGFFGVPGLAEALTAGRENVLLGHFHDLAGGAIGPADRAEYLRTYAQPARFAAGMAYYRSLDADTAAFLAYAEAPLDIPALGVGGALSGGTAAADSLRRAARDVRGVTVEGCGHFVPEERPAELAAAVLDFWAGTA